jgi:FAD:protein FMN transferase
VSVSHFRSMGCDIVVGGASAEDLERIRRLFEERDSTFSRFRSGSELRSVNAATVSRVTPAFAKTLRIALAAAGATNGLVSPAVGAAVEGAGYDRDFDLLADDGRRNPVAPAPGLAGLRVVEPLVHRPSGTTLDLNGVVKSLTADEALGLIAGDGFVSAGGDIAVRGRCVVGLPDGAAVATDTGGIATSGSTTRRWLRGGVRQHHLIDPRTGAPSTSRWAYVTVAARSCLVADVAAKAAFLQDADGPDWLDERGLAGRFVSHTGVVIWNAAWSDALCI